MAGGRTWALVTDGVRARILHHLENGNSEAPSEIVTSAPAHHLRSLLSGLSEARELPPGRGSGTDPAIASASIRRDILDFVRDTLDALERHRRAGRFRRLAIVADPRTLRVLRREMPASLKATVCAEVSANLIRVPAVRLRAELRRILSDRPGY